MINKYIYIYLSPVTSYKFRCLLHHISLSWKNTVVGTGSSQDLHTTTDPNTVAELNI